LQDSVAVRRFASPAYDEYLRITVGHMHDLQVARDSIAKFLSGGE
jgi:histidinol-phosphate/aromatic aminotransferase/cobyric acid decarboxylase-like protein